MTATAQRVSRAKSPVRTPAPAWRVADRIVRVLAGMALAAAAALLIVSQQVFRFLEAWTVASLLRPFIPGGAFAFGDRVVIQQDPVHYLGLQITVECTTLVLLVPTLLFCAGVIAFVRKVTWMRFTLGAAIGFVMIALINLARIGMIAAATLFWEHAGYEWSHVVVGTVFALIGIAVSLVVMLRIMTGPRRTKRTQARTPSTLPSGGSST